MVGVNEYVLIAAIVGALGGVTSITSAAAEDKELVRPDASVAVAVTV
jgi:hypothetical protein